MLGVGAFGVVWLAHPQAGGLPVALKILHPTAAESAEAVERFRREVYVLGRMESPHIARMYDFVPIPPVGLVLVMEFIEGELLSTYVARHRMSVEHAVLLGTDLLRAITEMHAHGIIHRDIKPENVMMRPTPEGLRAVVFDFNLSRLKASAMPGGRSSSLTAMGSAIGTVPYMAPEQLLDARRVAESADVYSAGAILYRAVAGRPAFEGPASLREKLVMEAPAVQTGRVDPLATGLERIIARAMRRKPQERYQEAAEMLRELEGLTARMSRPNLGG
jgi:serine/threonine-protein kinase